MNEIENIELTFLSIDDYQELKVAMIESYQNMPNSYWKEHHIKSLIDRFPEGQVVIKVNGQIAGCALSIIVEYGIAGAVSAVPIAQRVFQKLFELGYFK